MVQQEKEFTANPDNLEFDLQDLRCRKRTHSFNFSSDLQTCFWMRRAHTQINKLCVIKLQILKRYIFKKCMNGFYFIILLL